MLAMIVGLTIYFIIRGPMGKLLDNDDHWGVLRIVLAPVFALVMGAAFGAGLFR